MLKTKRVRPKIDYGKVRKSMTVPDQSLSIDEIVKRYVRGLPVDVIQRQGVYVDQNDHDLEKMSRMNFADQADMAEEMARKAEQIEEQHNERVREHLERKNEEAAKKKAKDKSELPGIEVLDNTMPVDTKAPGKQ